MGPRSDERGNDVAWCKHGSVHRLQWGRALMSAEIADLGRPRPSPPCASMGPRSDERGNAPGRAAAGTDRAALQWGRALMSAEICTPQTVFVVENIASMGPRSDERGNHP